MRLSQSKRAMSGELGPEGVRFEVPTKEQPADLARRLQEQGQRSNSMDHYFNEEKNDVSDTEDR